MPPKKKTASSSKTSPSKKVSSATSSSAWDARHTALAAMALLFAAAFAGSLHHGGGEFDDSKTIVRSGGSTYVAVKNLADEFKVELEAGNEFAVYDGKTWIPVEGSPVEVMVVTDPECGSTCDYTRHLSQLRQMVTPALLVREVDVNSDEGEDLVEAFEMVSIPAFVMGSELADLERGGQKVVSQLNNVLVQEDDIYMVDGTQVGFPPGKYIQAPEFDTVGEPSLGRGKLKVIEFTDYQCPYCKRLHDNNKDLIARLVDEGVIEYIVKDFPLAFHQDAVPIHAGANCALEIGGQDAYWEMNAKIFETQRDWSGKGVAHARQFSGKLAADIGLDTDAFAECLSDESVGEEINEDIAEGRKFGVTGTPSLFIGTQKMPGAIGPEAFEAAVNAEK